MATNNLLQRTRPVLTELLKLSVAVAAFGAALWGLDQAQSEQFRQPEYRQYVSFELIDAPAGVAGLVEQELAEFYGRDWIDSTLCEQVARRLADCPWVETVKRVSKAEPGLIRVQCDYRQPQALVQHGEYFYMVDEYGVRLPGVYGYQPEWLLVQGVSSAAPDPGETWPGNDIAAGLRLAGMILDQAYARQVVAVSVYNYGGREDPYRSHIELVTDSGGNRILWGSAPGEELEENSADQKLRILAENFRRHGRIDAHEPRIDISVFPSRFLIPA
ncbi:MAG: hypothetical protein IIA66_03925 [Planctomycetes bacterium]|nr:hypothetical protein [Planctomycetota bacterium]